ncbi:MAG: NAD(P)H-binding protein, partial [Rubrobacter sp.]
MVERDQPVLVVGGTGALGRRVIGALRARGKPVRALVRPGSDAGVLEGEGVEVVRGDMMDPASLGPAFDGVDALVTSAVGYTRHRKGDTSRTDTVGNRNLADAALNEGIRRFVFTGILNAHEAPDVPHFWHKKLAEDYLEQRGVPFVSLRPG